LKDLEFLNGKLDNYIKANGNKDIKMDRDCTKD